MVSGISGASEYQYQTKTETKLTDAQKTKLNDIMSKYDPDNMSQSDTKSMMGEIKDAGITPSKDLGETLNKAGFKLPEKPAAAAAGSSSILSTTSSSTTSSTTASSITTSTSDDLKTQLLDLLNKEGATNVDETDVDSFISNLKTSTNSNEGTIVDQFA